MKSYADIEFYKDSYLLGRTPKIPDAEFPYWAMLASGEIRQRTFGRVDALEDIPEEIRMCCCEVAEKLYLMESAKGENGMVLQSFSNDGESGTFKTDDMSEAGIRRGVSRCIRRWLIHTGLMYCGVYE